jgi:hypothetical protein
MHNAMKTADDPEVVAEIRQKSPQADAAAGVIRLPRPIVTGVRFLTPG